MFVIKSKLLSLNSSFWNFFWSKIHSEGRFNTKLNYVTRQKLFFFFFFGGRGLGSEDDKGLHNFLIVISKNFLSNQSLITINELINVVN